MSESIALSVLFFEHVKKVKKTNSGKLDIKDNYKEVVFQEILGMLNYGIPSHTIEKAIMDASQIRDSFYNLKEIFEELGLEYGNTPYVHDPSNLIEIGSFYYHKELQIVPPPPKVRIDDDGNFITLNEEEFFLELKTYYSIEDVLKYFYKIHKLANPKYQRRDMGAINYLLDIYELDHILFGIDTAYFVSIDKNKKPITSPLQIQDYLEEAEEILEQKKNSAKREGLNRVIPRKSAVL